MVLGKEVAILIGNGDEIRPLEMDRKSPEQGLRSIWAKTESYGSLHCALRLLSD